MITAKRLSFALVVLMVCCTVARAEEKIRIGVLGDSISKNRTAVGGKGWPLYLGKLLGDGYDVKTFSANGVDCLRVPSINIWSKSELPHLMQFKPNIVLIMLAANSARKGVEQYVTRYGGDYRYTIDYVRGCSSKPKVYCCAPTPVEHDNYGIQADILHGQFDPVIRKAAKEAGAPIIDTYNALKDQKGLTSDGVHPSVKGMQAIAIVVYKGLMGKDPPADKVAELAKEWQDEDAARKTKEAKAKADTKSLHDQVMDVLDERAKTAPKVATLTVDAVRDLVGDGPDRKGNTADDTWGFWFETVHAPGNFIRLDLATASMTPDQRENGITDLTAKRGKKKVQGPIASKLPNPKDSEGWIFHSDWNGCFEGVWGDKKADQVILYPYVEKNSHMGVAVTYLVAKAGKYTVTGKVTDLQVQPEYDVHDGVSWRIEVAPWDGSAGTKVAGGGPFGDGHGRPDSMDVKTEPFAVQQGQAIRFVVDPNKWWGSDMTKLEMKIERVEP